MNNIQLMKLHDFIERNKKAAWRGWPMIPAIVVVFMGPMFLVPLVMPWLKAHIGSRWLAFSLLVALMFGPTVVLTLCVRRFGRLLFPGGMSCPACNEPIAGLSAEVAIASGRCSNCGTEVLERPPDGGTMNRSAFAERLKATAHRGDRVNVGLLSLAVAGGLAPLFVKERLLSTGAPSLGTELLPLGGLAFLFGLLLLSGWLEHRRIRDNGLSCPACRSSLTDRAGQVAIATGGCGSCGAALFADDARQSEVMSRQELVELQKTAKRHALGFDALSALMIISGIIMLSFSSCGRNSSCTDVDVQQGLLLLLTVLLLAGAYAALSVWLKKKVLRNNNLLCRTCGHLLKDPNVAVALATGNCGHCGSPVVEGPTRPADQKVDRTDPS